MFAALEKRSIDNINITPAITCGRDALSQSEEITIAGIMSSRLHSYRQEAYMIFWEKIRME